MGRSPKNKIVSSSNVHIHCAFQNKTNKFFFSRHQIDQSHDQSQVAGGRRTIIANLGSAVIAGNIGSLEIITHNDISRAPRRDLPSLPKAMPARADNVFMNGGQVAILKNAGSLKMVST